MANYDPDRAARLLTDAEGIAGSIPDEGSKYWAMRGIAGALAATDPGRAERIATSIPGKSAKAAALSDIAVALAKSDPDRAERIATSIPNGLEVLGHARHRGGIGGRRPRPRRTHR